MGDFKPVQYDTNGNIVPVDKNVITRILWDRFLMFNGCIMRISLEGTPESFLKCENYTRCPEPFSITSLYKKIEELLKECVIKKNTAECFLESVTNKAKEKNIDMDADFSDGFAEVIGECCFKNIGEIPCFNDEDEKISLSDVLGLGD